MPERLATIVEGEGLTNDGTALVLYAGAVGAAVVGAVRPGPLVVTLLAAPAGGAALGLAVGWVVVAVRRRMDQPLLEITISLATPYVTYALADAAHLSGVLATVAAGVYVGSHLSAIYAPGARLQAFAFLDVLVFLLNAVLFTLVGAELVRSVHGCRGCPRCDCVAVLSAVVVVVVVAADWSGCSWTRNREAVRPGTGRARVAGTRSGRMGRHARRPVAGSRAGDPAATCRTARRSPTVTW